MKWRRRGRAEYVARMGKRRGAYRVLVGKPKGRRPLGRPKRRWEDNIKMGLPEVGWRACTGSIWLRIGADGVLLWMWLWTFRFHKISWLAEDLLASQKGLCSVELGWLVWKEGGWSLNGSVRGCCAFNEAGTIIRFLALLQSCCEKRLVASCPSVCLHRTARLPDGFWWNSVFENSE